METHAADLYVGAIEEEAAVRAEDEAADPEWRRVIVADRGPALHARNGAIHVGPFERPKVGVQYLELLRHVSDRVVRQTPCGGHGGDLLSRGIVNDRVHDNGLFVRRLIPQGGANADARRSRAHARRRDVRAPVIDVQRPGGDQPRMPVNTRAGVPARVRLLRVVDAHGDEVARRAVAQVRGELIAEGAVAVRPLAEVMAVDPDLTVSIHAVEFDENELVAVALCDSEGLTVPAHAAGERATARPGGIPRAELALDAPVVRQVERSPTRIVQGHVLPACYIAEMEFPVRIEVENDATLRENRGGRKQEGQRADRSRSLPWAQSKGSE